MKNNKLVNSSSTVKRHVNKQNSAELSDEDVQKIKLLKSFLKEFKKSVNSSKLADELTVCYAKMLEIIRKLAVNKNINLQELKLDNTNAGLQWYKSSLSKDEQVKNSQTNLLQRYYELLGVKANEVFKTGLGELLDGFKEVIAANDLTFRQVELARRDMVAKNNQIGAKTQSGEYSA